MSAFERWPLIPKVAPPTRFVVADPATPSRPRSPEWYLAHPTPLVNLCGPSSPTVRMWWCIAGQRRIEERQGDRVYVVDFCGAPQGVRCSCGTQLAGHDRGDEDPGQMPRRP